jgi:hypothetical protein
MATVTPSRRTTPSVRTLAAIAFIVGGALLALAALLGLAGSPAADNAHWVSFVADLAIAAGFALLAFEVVNSPTRIALIVAAAGWLLFAVGEVAGLPGQLGTVAAIAAAGGGLVSAILLRSSGLLGVRTSLVFLVATAIYAVLVFFQILGVDLQGVGLLLILLFAAGLIITGALLVQRSRPITEPGPVV